MTTNLIVQSATTRSGRFALHAVCDRADVAVLGHNHRSEVGLNPFPQFATNSPGGKPYYVLGEWWYGLSLYIPASWSNDDSSCSNCGAVGHWHLLTQWHHDGSVTPGDPAMQPLQLDAIDGTLQFEHYYGNAQSPGVVLWSAPLDSYKGRWVDVVVHANWTTDASAGYIKIWLDGSQIVDYHDHTAHSTGGGVSWKAGLTYDLDQSRDVYVDEMRMRDSLGSYGAVVPR